jgi:hypothetical protein
MLKKGLRIVLLAGTLYGLIVAASKIKQKWDIKKAGGNPKDVKWFK